MSKTVGDFIVEIADAARTLADAVVALRQGSIPQIGEDLPEPRQK